jgi:hypothetical protein
VPAGPWGRTWLVAVVAIALAVSGLELLARSHGYRPSVKDDEYAWAWQRARVSDGASHTVAVLGTSRILLAFSADAFEQALPGWTPVQLAIDGSQPAGSLIDLANDPEFRGVVIVDTIESGITPDNWERQSAYVAAYRRRWRAPGAMAERWLATWVQSHLALLSDRGLRVIASGWREPPYVTTFADRTQYADFSHTDVAERRRHQLERLRAAARPRPATEREADEWLTQALAIEPYIDQIQARGGRVVYVRVPVCDERWAADERDVPKALFWDRLAARTHALAIHFADYPTLRDFACPDTAHIDSKDAPRFTQALIAILAERGVFR